MTVGVGQYEQSPPVMCRTDFSRREHARSNAEAHSLKVSRDHVEAKMKMADDVFEKDPPGQALLDRSFDVRPEVPGVFGPSAATRRAEGLAWISCREEIHDATPRVTVEGFEIIPGRSLIQGLVRHPGHESGRGSCFLFDKTHTAVSWLGDSEGEFEASSSGAKGNGIKGT